MMSDRKQQILEVAADLMQTRAFSAFSYQDIADRLGITKAAIHSHYRTKELLGNALMEKYLEDITNFHNEAERSSGNAWDRLETFMTGSASLVIDENKVCPVCVLQLEHNVIQDSIKRGISKIYNANINWIAKILNQGRGEGVMVFKGNPEDQAALIIAANMGGLLNSRAEEHKLYKIIFEQIKKNMRPIH